MNLTESKAFILLTLAVGGGMQAFRKTAIDSVRAFEDDEDTEITLFSGRTYIVRELAHDILGRLGGVDALEENDE